MPYTNRLQRWLTPVWTNRNCSEKLSKPSCVRKQASALPRSAAQCLRFRMSRVAVKRRKHRSRNESAHRHFRVDRSLPKRQLCVGCPHPARPCTHAPDGHCQNRVRNGACTTPPNTEQPGSFAALPSGKLVRGKGIHRTRETVWSGVRISGHGFARIRSDDARRKGMDTGFAPCKLGWALWRSPLSNAALRTQAICPCTDARSAPYRTPVCSDILQHLARCRSFAVLG